MTKRLRSRCAYLFLAAGAVIAFLAPAPAFSADKPKLELRKGDRIILIGNTLAERMQYFGHFETLAARPLSRARAGRPQPGLVGRRADPAPAPGAFQGPWPHAQGREARRARSPSSASTNRSPARPASANSRATWKTSSRSRRPPSTTARTPPRLVLLSPIAHEDLKNPHITDGKKNNENIKLYTDAMAELAGKHGVVFVDLFTPSKQLYEASDQPLTINGIHLSDEGYRQLGPELDEALFGPRPARSKADLKALHAAVQEKNLQFFYDYRAVNGCYIYGGRKAPFGVVNFPAEFAKLRKMIENRERAHLGHRPGQDRPGRRSTTATPAISSRSRPTSRAPIKITTPDEEQKTFTLPEGYAINLFASEVEFPDLEDPVSMTFDAKGRLWVGTMPSYPMYLPGTKPNDKVLILEDTNGDGKADRCTTFADGLHLPIGIELGDGGVYLSQMPNLMFLKDTDGDDRADTRELIMHGFDTADSHHAMHAFTWDPGGALHWQEGTFHYSQVETPYGPRRCNEAGIFRWEPRSRKFDVFVSYGFANPWGHYIDRWGQNFVADASGGANYFGTAFSGQVVYPQKHGGMKQFFPMQWRPTCGCELVYSRHFPDDTQGDYLLNNNIGFQGILRYRVKEDGSGFAGTPVEPLLKSTDPNFRPVALQFGPDGALYVVDWFNPLVGHMQHSLRDPNRDHTHGRIWRITYPKRPLVEQAADRRRHRCPSCSTCSSRTKTGRAIAPAASCASGPSRKSCRHSTSGSPASTRATRNTGGRCSRPSGCTRAWTTSTSRCSSRLLTCPEPRARAAATRVLCYWRDRVSDPLELLRKQVNDEHPRVRLEAIRALSFFDGDQVAKAQEIALESLLHPQDDYLEYTLNETNKTLDRRIKDQSKGR